MTARPIVHVIAGPNGAGKTTFARRFLPQFSKCDEFVNADLLAQGLSPFAPERAAFRAARLMLKRIDELHRLGAHFGFETTLAGRGHIALLQRLRTSGYAIHLYFLWLPNVEMAVERVAYRVKQGGHNIEKSVIRRRYVAGVRNLFQDYRPLLDQWMLFDNSQIEPKIIARETNSILHVAEHSLFAAATRNLNI